MARAGTVIRSIESPDGSRCVDLIRRSDGSFGFAEFRRDPEDGRGWYPTGAPPEDRYPTEREALDGALSWVPWLAMVLR